ncbi:hypothetical protein PVAND_010220 [Polypedilum vanderplanki]|uniref:Uncharacterized protein n=1 Tax=Polypedilum vanderplanki TaxID=319348 RepID=A0A9J6CF21_POLVA|nr:hypothetical protein PVAND_010220 [Polypedilum vanderplanki]
MGNCFSVKNERDQNHYPRQNRNEPSSLSPPPTTRLNAQSNLYPNLSTPTFTTQAPEAIPVPQPQPQPVPQIQYVYLPLIPPPQESIDSSGFTVLSKNPHLRYKANSLIQNDGMAKIYIGYLSDKKVLLKEFSIKQNIDSEIAILSSLDHKNIIKFIMKFEALNNRLFLVTDFGEKISRSLHLKNDVYKKDAMMHLTSAVDYLQKMEIIHFQIVPENIFVVNHGSSCTFKLGNFSKSIVSQTKTLKQFQCIEGYTAPEIFMQNYSLASDIWSLGCLFYYFVTAQKMNTIINQIQMGRVIGKIKSIKEETTSIILFKDLLIKMLKFQGSKRLSTADIQKHPYFWNAKQMIDLIVNVSRIMERDDNELKTFLFKGSSRVIGDSWVQRIDEDVTTELKVIKKNYRNFNRGGGKKKEDLNETSIKSLITTIRNISVHDRSSIMIFYMGDNDEQLMDYWNLKFPYLIEHIYNATLQYNNKENIY